MKIEDYDVCLISNIIYIHTYRCRFCQLIKKIPFGGKNYYFIISI